MRMNQLTKGPKDHSHSHIFKKSCKKTFRVAPDEWEGGSANMFQSGQRQQTSQTQKYLGSENKNFAVKDSQDKNFVQNLCVENLYVYM